MVQTRKWRTGSFNEKMIILAPANGGFMECKYCKHEIDDRTDDYFNSDHSKIKCPHCEEWQDTTLVFVWRKLIDYFSANNSSHRD